MSTHPNATSAHPNTTSTRPEIAPARPQTSSETNPARPTILDSYYHDYRVLDQSGKILFVSAALTSCSLDPKHSYETILPNSCPYASPLLYLEFSPALWDSPVFDEDSGRSIHLPWRSDLNVKSLTNLSLKTLTHHSVQSSPARVYTARPSAVFGTCPAFSDNLTYPEGLDRSLPIFRPTDPDLITDPANITPDLATHLFIKVPWRPHSQRPEHTKITRFAPLAGLHYWSAINDYYRCGVDYWLVPLAR